MAPSRGSAHSLEKPAQRRGQHQPLKHRNASGLSSNSPSVALQQRLLDVFVRAFPHLLTRPNVDKTLPPILQEVKGHLYTRDFDKAFGRRDFLEAYAARWSASRALGYLEIFSHAFNEMPIGLSHIESEQGSPYDISASTSNQYEATITCLGGGAGAEFCALAALPHQSTALKDANFKVSLIDAADWSTVLDTLYKAVTCPPSNSASLYAAQESDIGRDHTLISEAQMAKTFHCIDLLSLSQEDSSVLNDQLQKSHLVTLMFTLNELYNTSMPKTQTLLLDLTVNVKPQTLLLVVDSAGSYSTVTVNQKVKKYPMQWLLDHTLLTLAPGAFQGIGTNAKKVSSSENNDTEKNGQTKNDCDGASKAVWERISSTDSRWFRLPELRYPIELENMRYQLHLYRRL